MELINKSSRIPLEIKKIVLHVLNKPSTIHMDFSLIEQLSVQSHYSANER